MDSRHNYVKKATLVMIPFKVVDCGVQWRNEIGLFNGSYLREISTSSLIDHLKGSSFMQLRLKIEVCTWKQSDKLIDAVFWGQTKSRFDGCQPSQVQHAGTFLGPSFQFHPAMIPIWAKVQANRARLIVPALPLPQRSTPIFQPFYLYMYTARSIAEIRYRLLRISGPVPMHNEIIPYAGAPCEL